MIKQHPIKIILTLILFLVINLSYFWEGEFGILTFPIFFILLVVFIILGIVLLREIHKSINEKFKNKTRNYLLVFMAVTLSLIAFKPTGIINFDKLEGENLYFAQAEGSANCTSTLKLKKSNKFIYESVCFGIEKTKGTYVLKENKILFKDHNKNKFAFEYATINLNNNSISLYRKQNDKNPFTIPIIKK